MRILILGGYGTFGGRLVRLLADEPRLVLLIAGRSQEKASGFAASIDAAAELVPCALDRNGDLDSAFAALAPDLVVDASGPFQVYGDAPLRVAEAAISAGIGYLDLADGAEFVESIAQLDARARARGVFILSGASTFPALSFAVVRRLSAGWQRITGIEAALAPSPKAGLGGNVIRAILSYAGKPLSIRRGGKTTQAAALIDARRRTIAPPGTLPLQNMRFTLVDVPDLRLASGTWPDVQDLWVGVATRPQVLHRLLSLCACLVRWRFLRSLPRFAGIAERTMRLFPFGEHRGGMAIRVKGLEADGAPVCREWHMIAEGDDGPFIPSMAAEILIRKMLDGQPPRPGARAATNAVDLADYEAAFAKRRITTGLRETVDGPLYRRMLGESWHRLPGPIRLLHTDPDGKTMRGRARVERGGNPLARLIGALVGFPAAGEDVPVEVRFSERDGGELWQRRFAGKWFHSFQKHGSGGFSGLLSERFGPLEFGLALVAGDERLTLVTRGWRAFGIPMPRFLAPGGEAFEHVVDGRFHFHVEISHPITGLIVRYRGWLVPDGQS